jgi:hypothetical protein
MPNSFIYEKPGYIAVKVTTELDDQVNLYCTIVNETTEEYKTL